VALVAALVAGFGHWQPAFGRCLPATMAAYWLHEAAALLSVGLLSGQAIAHPRCCTV